MINSPAVHLHLKMLQDVISRMAANSASAKTWCITLVSAILVLTIEKNNLIPFYFYLFPIVLFYILDVYYLAYERAFREEYNQFVNGLENQKDNLVKELDVFKIKPVGNIWTWRVKSIWSFSTTGFYALLAVFVLVLGCSFA